MTSKIIECTISREKQHDNISEAMKKLTGAGFRLYSYLFSMAELEEGRTIFQLLQDDVCAYTGLSARSYYTAVNDLTKNGYIKPKTGKRRYFLFDGTGE